MFYVSHGIRLMTDMIRPDITSTLLVGTESSHGGVEPLVRQGFDRLIGVLCGDQYEPLVEAWERAGGDLGRIRLIGLGMQMRASAALEERGGPAPTLIHGMPFDHLERLPGAITSMQRRDSETTQVVYIEGLHTFLAAAGIGRTYAMITDLIEELAEQGGTVVATVPAEAPTAVATGFAPKFDRVVEPVPDGESTTLQPCGRIGGLSTAAVFDLLGPSRRRVLLWALDTRRGAMSISELVDVIAKYPIEASLARDPDRLRLGLFQSDLPKLADAGIIDLDREAGQVTMRPEAVQLWPYLTLSAQSQGI